MATTGATTDATSCGSGDVRAGSDQMAAGEAQPEIAGAVIELGSTALRQSAARVVVEFIKPDPDAGSGVEVASLPPRSSPVGSGLMTVLHCNSLQRNGDDSAEVSGGGPSPVSARNSPSPSAPSPSPPPASPLTPPPPPPSEEQLQSPLAETKEPQPQEPMEVVETLVLVPKESSSAAPRDVDISTTRQKDGALISGVVTWMRPPGESIASEPPPRVPSVTAAAPTGAARRKATGVAPRRVIPDLSPILKRVEGTSPGRDTSGSRGVSVISAGVSSGSVDFADVSAAAAPTQPTQTLPFDCDVCQTRFGDRLALATHAREHGGAAAEPCRRCGRLLVTPLDRARHERRHRAAAGRDATTAASKRRQASVVNAEAIATAAPTRLLPQRRGRNPTRCGACGEQFRGAALREHFAPHPRTGFYPCASCDDAFAQECQLELHVCSQAALLSAPPPLPPRCSQEVIVKTPPASPPEQQPPVEVCADNDGVGYVEEEYDDVYTPPSGRLKRSSSNNIEVRTAKSPKHSIKEEGFEGKDDSGEGDLDGGDDGGDDDSGGDGGSHQCPHCGRRFASARGLSRHISKHTNPSRLRCEVCNRVYSRLDALVRHSVEAHDQKREFPCPQCRWKFTQRGILEYHLKAHEEGGRGPGRKPRPFRCKACKRSFMEQAQLDAHECRDHSSEAGYVCDICGKTIKTKVWLSRHRLLHDDVRPAKCQICGQGFIDDKALAKHVKTHTDGRRFLCDICGKGFALKITLQIHSRTHTGERPYACETCGKRFCTRTQLFHHSKIHSGVKPYVCSVCQRGFRQSHHLKTHMKIHEDCPEREAREARNARALEPPVAQLVAPRPVVPAVVVQVDDLSVGVLVKSPSQSSEG